MTMTITIEAPDDVAQAIEEKAAREGLSLAEYTLSALLEKTASPAADQDAKGNAKREARARLDARRAAGAFAGLSVDGFLAERAEDLRLEQEQEAAREKSRIP